MSIRSKIIDLTAPDHIRPKLYLTCQGADLGSPLWFVLKWIIKLTS